MAKTVIGTFESRQQAEEAVSRMRERGFSENEISVLARDQGGDGGDGGDEGVRGGGTRMGGDNVGEGVGWGTGIGAGAGLLASAGALAIPGIGPIVAAGPIAATLSGAVTGGIAGGLLDYGIPQERGRHYEGQLRQGKVLCVVKAEDRKADEAASFLREAGARDVESHQAGA